MQEIQDLRASVVVPGGSPLHEYVNLYICGRNPMLFKRKHMHAQLCVLRVSPDVLNLPETVVTDSNASSRYVRFAAAPEGLRIVDRDLAFAEDWTHPDPIEYFRCKSAKCAEVLVPDRIGPEFLLAIYVSCQESLRKINALNLGLEAIINEHLFFI